MQGAKSQARKISNMEQIVGKIQICTKCAIPKDIEKDFRNRFRDGSVFVEKVCKQCQYERTSIKRKSEASKQQKREHYAQNKESINALRRSKYVKRERVVKEKVSREHRLQKIKEWQQANPDKRKVTIAKYHEVHLVEEKQYYRNNQNKIKARAAEYRSKNRELINEKLKERRKDPLVKLRHQVSVLIRHYINLETKKGSCMKYLPYTIQELKQHLENQFESWMNWNNWGEYRKSWNDQDSTTWTWQIDHITPQSKLPYTSMEDENFKKCWALENLRPLSAKRNVIEGSRLERK